tara:strand:- start:2671 stop:3189 length:519 start_codon:yes stop_codon:yes gene_type:complete
MIYKLLSRLGVEIWKDIPNFKNYQVSNLGNVRSLNYNRTGKTKVLMKHINNRGRYTLNLYKKGIRYSNRNISVLVAQSFLNHKPCGHKLVVDHINNISTNDKLYNLQVITHRLNVTKDKKGTSKYAGVFWDKARNKWTSFIKINNKNIYLGSYKNEQEAAQAYQKQLNKIKL